MSVLNSTSLISNHFSVLCVGVFAGGDVTFKSRMLRGIKLMFIGKLAHLKSPGDAISRGRSDAKIRTADSGDKDQINFPPWLDAKIQLILLTGVKLQFRTFAGCLTRRSDGVKGGRTIAWT